MATRTKELLNLPTNQRDFFQAIIYGYGTTAPTDAVTGAGEAGPGSLYVDITNKVVYHNTGTLASPVWNSLGGVTAGEITLATGSILLGAAGVGAALDVKGDGKILVGNGTTATSVAVSGDITITNAGVTAIGAGKVTNAMHVAASEDGTVVKVAADANVIGAIPVYHRITIADSAGDTTVVLTHKTRIIDFYAVKTSTAGGAGDTLTLKNVATAITNALDLNVADKAVVRAGTIDDAQWEVAAGANLVVTAAKNTSCAAEVVVVGLRVA